MEVTKLYIIKWLPVLAVFSIMMVVACSSDEAAAPAPAPAAVAAPAPAPAPAAAPASKAPVQAQVDKLQHQLLILRELLQVVVVIVSQNSVVNYDM